MYKRRQITWSIWYHMDTPLGFVGATAAKINGGTVPFRIWSANKETPTAAAHTVHTGIIATGTCVVPVQWYYSVLRPLVASVVSMYRLSVSYCPYSYFNLLYDL
jgi:hypothetical protein